SSQSQHFPVGNGTRAFGVADKAGDLWGVAHDVTGIVIHFHLDQDVARKRGFANLFLLAAFQQFFRAGLGNENRAKFVFSTELLDAFLESGLGLVFVHGIGMHDIPTEIRIVEFRQAGFGFGFAGLLIVVTCFFFS